MQEKQIISNKIKDCFNNILENLPSLFPDSFNMHEKKQIKFFITELSRKLSEYQSNDEYISLTDLKFIISHLESIKHYSKKIFISYAWPQSDDKNYEEWTQDFVNDLVAHLIYAGFQVYLDQNKSGAGYPLHEFMAKIHQVDHVLVISTRTMGEKLKYPESGVCYEYKQISECINKNPDLLKKRFIVPVLLNNQKYCHEDFKGLAELSFCSGYFNGLKELIVYLYGFGSVLQKEFQEF